MGLVVVCLDVSLPALCVCRSLPLVHLTQTAVEMTSHLLTLCALVAVTSSLVAVTSSSPVGVIQSVYLGGVPVYGAGKDTYALRAPFKGPAIPAYGKSFVAQAPFGGFAAPVAAGPFAKAFVSAPVVAAPVKAVAAAPFGKAVVAAPAVAVAKKVVFPAVVGVQKKQAADPYAVAGFPVFAAPFAGKQPFAFPAFPAVAVQKVPVVKKEEAPEEEVKMPEMKEEIAPFAKKMLLPADKAQDEKEMDLGRIATIDNFVFGSGSPFDVSPFEGKDVPAPADPLDNLMANFPYPEGFPVELPK